MPRRRSDETRADILRAAAALFAGQGYKGTSLQEIADQVGYSKAALLYHFPSKAAILAELITPGREALATLLAAGTGSPVEIGHAFVAMALRFRTEVGVLFGIHDELCDEPELAGLHTLTEQLVLAMTPAPGTATDRVHAVVVLAGCAAACQESTGVEDDSLRDALDDVVERVLSRP